MEDASAHVHSAGAKPRILRSLSGALSEGRLTSVGGDACASVQAAVRNHNLLCETFTGGSTACAVHATAIDQYFIHLDTMALPYASAGSKLAASVLLAQAATECGPRRFVGCMSRWGTALGKLVDGKDGDGLPTAAARHAMHALVAITRRASSMMDVPGVRKEAAVVAQKLVNAALRWLDDDAFTNGDVFTHEANRATAVTAIKQALEGHPSALRPKVDVIETALVKALYSCTVHDNSQTQRELLKAIAYLPRTGASSFQQSGSGVADAALAFSQQMRRVLVALHGSLDDGLQNMEPLHGGNSVTEQRTALVPLGAAPPAAFGGPLGEGDGPVTLVSKNNSETHLHRSQKLFKVIVEMLRQPFPNAAGVPLPADLVLGVVRRALNADGAGVSTAPGLPATAAPAEALGALPGTHVVACECLAALLECSGPALVRLTGPVARVLDGVLRAGAGTSAASSAQGKRGNGKPQSSAGLSSRPSTCATTRAAAYLLAASAARALGPASCAGELASVVVPHAANDAVLGWGTAGSAPGPFSAKRSKLGRNGNARKKGKGGAWGHAGSEEMESYLASGGVVDQRGGIAGGGLGRASDVVKRNALHALEAILTNGGAMVPSSLRTLIDASCAEAASAAVTQALGGTANVTSSIEVNATGNVSVRKAAYAALLASALAPRTFRATNLPLAACLFRKAKTCDVELRGDLQRHALAIEALLHPASAPLHPTAIAPPKESVFADPGVSAFANAGGWGEDDAFGRTTPNWGSAPGANKEASPALSESEEEEEENEEEEEEEDDEAAVVEPSVLPAVAKRGGENARTEAPVAKKAKSGANKAENKAGLKEKHEAQVPVLPEAEPVSSSVRGSRAARGKAVVAPAPVAPAAAKAPKKLTAKETKKAEAENRKRVGEELAAAQTKPAVSLGLGTGKSSVQMELSDDDSDGELPEIVD